MDGTVQWVGGGKYEFSTVCPRSLDQIYIVIYIVILLIFKMGQDFLDRQYQSCRSGFTFLLRFGFGSVFQDPG